MNEVKYCAYEGCRHNFHGTCNNECRKPEGDDATYDCQDHEPI